MKKISKFVFAVLIFSFFVNTSVFAEEMKDTKPSISPTTSVREATIVSNKDNVINLSFSISNEEGAQAGVKYGVQLLKQTKEGSFLSDEYMNDEVISIAENSLIKKEFTYKAPSLSGEYKIYIVLKNESGRNLGIGYAGKINLVSSKKSIEIMPESCSLSISSEKNSKYNLFQGVDIALNEDLTLNCVAFNPTSQSITATPYFETYRRSISGEMTSQSEVKNSTITFKSQEKKNISLLLPKANSPQAYDLKVLLKNGEENSNQIIVHYVIQGLSATIQSLSFDANSYKIGDNANISMLLASSADSFPESRAGSFSSAMTGVSINIDVLNEKGNKCIKTIEEDANQFFDKEVNIPAKIIGNCNNFTAKALLKDSSGNILDEKSITFNTAPEKEASKNNNLVYIILGLIVVVGAIGYIIISKKNKNENNI